MRTDIWIIVLKSNRFFHVYLEGEYGKMKLLHRFTLDEEYKAREYASDVANILKCQWELGYAYKNNP